MKLASLETPKTGVLAIRPKCSIMQDFTLVVTISKNTHYKNIHKISRTCLFYENKRIIELLKSATIILMSVFLLINFTLENDNLSYVVNSTTLLSV